MQGVLRPASFYDSAVEAIRGSPNLQKWGLYALLLLASWILARLVARYLLVGLMRTRRVQEAIVQLLGRLFVFSSLVAAVFVFATLIFDADVAALAATLGLVSLAVGFGLQNTVANIAGGISLALDRPFRLGDQIEVGSFVGDVQAIGIRSTRILTPRKEFIIIPNKYLEEQPILNYTMGYPELRIDVPVGISFDSDRVLAEQILKDVAGRHPVVLRKPAPRVLVKAFGANSIDLELWCWIAHPRNRWVVRSDLLKSIQDRFEAEGVEIPYPYQTNLEKADLPTPRRLPPAERHGVSGARPPPRTILVSLAGPPIPEARSDYLLGLAKALNAHLVGVYSAPDDDPAAHDAADLALHRLERKSESRGIWFKPIARFRQERVQATVDVAEEEDPDLVVLGIDRGRGHVDWPLRSEPTALSEAMLRPLGLRAPVHEAPASGRLTPQMASDLEERIRAFRGDRLEARRADVVVSPPEPRSSEPPPEEAPAEPKTPIERPADPS